MKRVSIGRKAKKQDDTTMKGVYAVQDGSSGFISPQSGTKKTPELQQLMPQNCLQSILGWHLCTAVGGTILPVAGDVFSPEMNPRRGKVGGGGIVLLFEVRSTQGGKSADYRPWSRQRG